MIDFVTNIIGVRVLLITVAILLLTAIGLGVAVEIQGTRLDTAHAKNTTLTVQLQGLGNQITAQNGAIDQMLANAATAADHLKTAEAAAGRIRVITQDRIQYVQLAAIPVTCPEAVSWGALHAIEIGTRWQEATP